MFAPKKNSRLFQIFFLILMFIPSSNELRSRRWLLARSRGGPILRWVGAQAPTQNLKLRYYWLVFFEKCAKVLWILKEYALTQILCPQSKYSLGPPLHRSQVLGHGYIRINMQYKPFHMPSYWNESRLIRS